MPRVTIKQQTYKLTDFSKWVKSQMVLNDMTQEDLASELGITQPALSYKFKNHKFTLEECLKIFNLFQPKPEVLRELLII